MIDDVEAESTVLHLWLYDQGAFGTQSANVSDFVGPDSDGGTEAEPLADYLQHLGLAEQVCMGGIRLSLTPEGVHRAQQIRRNRKDPARRIPELQRRILLWLSESERNHAASVLTFLSTDHAEFLGDRFSEEEVIAEAGYLQESGLILAHRTWQGSWLRPSLTPTGRECLINYGGDVSNYRRSRDSGGGNITNNYFPNNAGNVAVGNHNNIRQLATQGLDVSALAEFAAMLSQLAPVLPDLFEDDQAQVREAAGGIEAELVKAQPDGGKLRKLGEALLPILRKTGPSAVTPMLTELGRKAAEVIHQLPPLP